jgi:hypothetical protein
VGFLAREMGFVEGDLHEVFSCLMTQNLFWCPSYLYLYIFD